MSNDDYQTYLQEKHSRFSTSDTIVGKLVYKATKSHLKTKEKLILGENSEVYKITTVDNQKIIIRISRRKSPRFEIESWVINQANLHGVPTPKILLIEQIVSDGEQLDISIQSEIHGQILGDVIYDLNKNEQYEIVKKAGNVLSKIHSVQTNGFGYLDRNGNGKYASWEEFMSSLVNKKAKLIQSARNVDYDTQIVEKLLEILQSNLYVFKNVIPQLIHCDFGPKHIFIHDSEIIGVIDFEGSKGGDPVRDLVWWEYFFGDSLPLKWLLDGYENKDLTISQNFQKRFFITEIHLALGLLEYYSLENNSFGINHTKLKLDKIFEKTKKYYDQL